MYAILSSIPFFLWGYYAFTRPELSFGPMFGGAISIAFGAVLFMLGVIHLLDKIWPIKISGTREQNEYKYTARQSVLLYGALPVNDEERNWLEALNTPDPNLIHPDDAKRLDMKV